MFKTKIALAFLSLVVTFAAAPQTAEAGPLLDWFRNVCRRPRLAPAAQSYYTNYNQPGCNTCAQPNVAQPQFVNTSLNTPNVAGLQPGQCMRTCNQVCSRTVVNYVPVTAYRTAWNRVPVTQYRPVTNSDPCTGCTVTCMRPCTSYTWQMKREPYTTYRAVYSQQNYTVPVTTITNDCATGTCGTCQTCPTSSYSYPSNGAIVTQPTITQGAIAPGTTTNLPGVFYTEPGVTAPSGTISTEGSFDTPANEVPSLDSYPSPQDTRRPAIQRFEQNVTPRIEGPLQTINQNFQRAFERVQPVKNKNNGWMNSAPVHTGPRMIPVDDMTAQSPVRKRWAYSPVRLASYTSVKPESAETPKPMKIKGVYTPARKVMKTITPKPQKKNAGWETVDW